MVCPRCITAVENVFIDMNVQTPFVRLGEVTLIKELSAKQFSLVKQRLEELGFEMLDSIRTQQIEQIKAIVINHIHNLEDGKFVFSDIIANELNKEYSQLSKLFSLTEGITIEQYIILQKIEKVKELLRYNEMNLSEISDKMGYSSVGHLSTQFKKTIGLTPSQFKAQSTVRRKSLDSI